MKPGEKGFLLLTSKLADPERKPLTVAQFRNLAKRVSSAQWPQQDRELEPGDLIALGYDAATAEHIVALLAQTQLLEHYLSRGKRRDCYPITRVSPGYPLCVRKKLGLDSPGCLWAKGDAAILETPRICLVGSRDLLPENREFAYEAGKQAALQGYTLVSGNARGADRTAQKACLEYGGKVISIVADELEKCPLQRNVLYMAEDGYDMPFSGIRALSRNRVIHTLGEITLVAQTTLERGGSWDGTVRNLHNGWNSVYCYADGTQATARLADLGAETIGMEELQDLCKLCRSSKQIKMEELL